jgi:hypothetical protein
MRAKKKSQAELKQLWRERLLQCGARYESSVADFCRVLREQKQLGSAAPNGSVLRKAFVQISATHNEYIRVLRIFTDLLMSAEFSEED